MMQQKSKKDTYSYQGWLNSDNFLKRAFAIYGYSITAGLIITVPVYIIVLIGWLIASAIK